jgi:hypothetical protein
MGIVALGQVKRDDPILVAGHDLAMTAGEQVERETDRAVSDLDRELEFVQPEDQPTLCGLGDPVLAEPQGVAVGWVLVSLQLKHSPTAELGSAIQLQPQRSRFAQIGRSALTATIVPSSREYPTAEPHVTQTEFSKNSSARHTSH